MLDLRKKPVRPLVAGSILASDFGAVAADAADVLAHGADLLHLDVMDGHFVGNLTMGEDMIRALRRHLPKTFLDVHLMVDHPAMYVESFAKAGASHFTFHLEVCDPVRARHGSAASIIQAVRDHGMSVGMCINPLTDDAGLDPWLDQLDMVLVMSVHPGKGGQAFIPEVLPKTRRLAARLRDDQRLEMDGGLAPDTAPAAVAAGVDVLVAGSALFGAPDRAAAIRALRGG